MLDFQFDPALDATGNLERFFDYLRSVDKEMTDILEANLPAMRPLPPQGANRNNIRRKINKQIEIDLDKPPIDGQEAKS